ncbi:MAG: hypothetical protein F6K39_23765 [Okeania sp. SIO3B3]|nr:hypothetical protein [Okeania sp. SIO3B3]
MNTYTLKKGRQKEEGRTEYWFKGRRFFIALLSGHDIIPQITNTQNHIPADFQMREFSMLSQLCDKTKAT